ncbi:MAG: hypothetical protein OXC56_06540, partial [Chloroflexi bacterium]|nr:hypothetical protein [Chloroflexota bacterium]
MSTARWLALAFATAAVVATFALPQGWAAAIALVAVLALLGVALRTGARRPPAPAAPADPAPESVPESPPVESSRPALDMVRLRTALHLRQLAVRDANPAFAGLGGHPIEGMLDASLIRATREYDLTTAVREGPGG